MKNSFILYHSYKKHFQSLSNEQKGILFDAIFDYSETETVPKLEPVLMMAFNFIAEDLDQNREKWELRANASRENGKYGGRPRVTVNLDKPKKPSGLSSNLDKPRKPVSVNVNGSVSVNDIKEEGVVKQPDILSRDSFKRFITKFNEYTKRSYKANDQVYTKYKARIRDGYTLKDIGRALTNAFKDDFLTGENDRGRWYLTPEYILRTESLEKWLNVEASKLLPKKNVQQDQY